MFDPNTQNVTDAIKKLCEEAYQRGFAEGGEAMRDKIMKAAEGFGEKPNALRVTNILSPIINSTKSLRQKGRERAPRGSVTNAITSMLLETPGLTTSDMERVGARRFPDISPKSFGNELRRFENDRYKRDQHGGYKWFLIEQDVPGEEHGGSKGGETPSAVDVFD